MITDIHGTSVIGPELRRDKLEHYWSEYFAFLEQAPELHAISEARLAERIESARSMEQPYIDSQQAIASVLTELGESATFHRQFNESFPDFKSHQVLGMQLYAQLAAEEHLWVYSKTQHIGHAFPHSTYFQSNA